MSRLPDNPVLLIHTAFRDVVISPPIPVQLIPQFANLKQIVELLVHNVALIYGVLLIAVRSITPVRVK